jgi:hypothetical protein
MAELGEEDRRNGSYARQLLTALGAIELCVPRTRRFSAGSIESTFTALEGGSSLVRSAGRKEYRNCGADRRCAYSPALTSSVAYNVVQCFLQFDNLFVDHLYPLVSDLQVVGHRPLDPHFEL